MITVLSSRQLHKQNYHRVDADVAEAVTPRSSQAALSSELSRDREAFHGYTPLTIAGLGLKHHPSPSLTHSCVF